MEKRKEYSTGQKLQLLSLLHASSGEELSINEITERIGGTIGRSTVYRLMGKLVADGCVKKFLHDGNRGFVYQLACCEESVPHYHMKCTSCGRLVHVDNDMSKKLFSELLSRYGFLTDEKSATLYGCCAECEKDYNDKEGNT